MKKIILVFGLLMAFTAARACDYFTYSIGLHDTVLTIGDSAIIQQMNISGRLCNPGQIEALPIYDALTNKAYVIDSILHPNYLPFQKDFKLVFFVKNIPAGRYYYATDQGHKFITVSNSSITGIESPIKENTITSSEYFNFSGVKIPDINNATPGIYIVVDLLSDGNYYRRKVFKN